MDASQSSSNLTATAHQAVDRLADVAGRTAQNLARRREQLSQDRAEILANCRSYINENPGMSLGVAVAAGFLLRHLIRPR